MRPRPSTTVRRQETTFGLSCLCRCCTLGNMRSQRDENFLRHPLRCRGGTNSSANSSARGDRDDVFVSGSTWKQLPYESFWPRPTSQDVTLTLPRPLPSSPWTCLDLLLYLPTSSLAPQGQTVRFFQGAARENTQEFHH